MKNEKPEDKIFKEIEDLREEVEDKEIKEKINQIHYSFQLFLEEIEEN